MNAIVEHDNTPRLPTLQSGGAVRAIVPQDFEGAWRIATAVVKAGMAPKGLDSSEKAMVAIMHGLEVGLTPMAALQSIAVVNGRPTIWGDGAIGLVRGSGKLEWLKERIEGDGDRMIAVCEVKRRGENDPAKGTFSVDDAKKAGLWGKSGPWQQYPKRMLAMRARAFVLRDTFADVLRGLGIAEEVQDTPMRDVTPPAPPKPPAPPPAVEEAVFDEPIDQAEDMQVERETDESRPDVDATQFFEDLEIAMAGAKDEAGVEEAWVEFDPLATFDGDDINIGIATAIKNRRLKALGAK